MILDTVVYGDITVGDILYVAMIIAAALIVSRIITLNLRRALSPRLRKTELDIILRAIYYGILVLAVIVALPALNIELSGLLVAGGFIGLVIGFASQSVVGNLVSGLFLLVEHPIVIGDEIEIGDVSGTVEDIRFLSTIVRTYDGVNVRMPNEQVFTSNITNLVANPARRIEYTVGIGYGSDIQRALQVIAGVLEEYSLVLKRPSPDIYVKELGESSVDIVVRFWAPTPVFFGVRKEMLRQIKLALDADGIEIPFPQRVVWFGKSPDPAGQEPAESGPSGRTEDYK